MLSTKLILEDIGSQIVNQLRNDIKTKSLVSGYSPPNASGKLHDSIRYEATESNLKVYALNYIGALEFGRKPTQKSQGGALRPAIRKWIDDKGILPRNKNGETPKNLESAKNSLAYLIARKIHAKGTLIYQQGGSDLLSSIINDSFIAKMKQELIFNTVESIKSEILKGVTA